MEKITKMEIAVYDCCIGTAVSMLGSHGVQFALIWWLAEKIIFTVDAGNIRACRLSSNDLIQSAGRNCG